MAGHTFIVMNLREFFQTVLKEKVTHSKKMINIYFGEEQHITGHPVALGWGSSEGETVFKVMPVGEKNAVEIKIKDITKMF